MDYDECGVTAGISWSLHIFLFRSIPRPTYTSLLEFQVIWIANSININCVIYLYKRTSWDIQSTENLNKILLKNKIIMLDARFGDMIPLIDGWPRCVYPTSVTVLWFLNNIHILKVHTTLAEIFSKCVDPSSNGLTYNVLNLIKNV